MFAPMYALNQLMQCFIPVLAAVIGFVLFNKSAWCDASLGKLTKSKCDVVKKALFGFVGGFLVLSVLAGMGMGGGGMGGGMGMGY